MLKVEDVSVQRGKAVTLRGVTFDLPAGKTLSVVGESGAGKSTMIGVVLGLLQPASGRITWDEAPVGRCHPALVMQEPRAAFNPALSLRRSVCEPLSAHGAIIPEDRLARLCDGLELPMDLLGRRPGEVSIGQAQRAGILRALIGASPLVLFDEPLSALDAVTQKHTARLIADLQREEGFAALIVTHDMGYAAAFSDQIAVLRTGQIEELSSTSDFIREPQSSYGLELREAAVALGALERAA
ncbi:MAG: ATP-binding cassette domain-containing protein [Pseudomonadota bacterium]